MLVKNHRKEALWMLKATVYKRNISMCCRMLYSRAYNMAGAFGCPFMRLVNMQE